jgi:class 3 adenylate cyclase
MPETPKKPTPPDKPRATPAKMQTTDGSPAESAKPKHPSGAVQALADKLLKTSPGLRLSSLSSGFTPLLRSSDLFGRTRTDDLLRLAGLPRVARVAPSARVQELEAEIAAHRAELQKQTAALKTEQKNRQELEGKLQEFERTQAKLKMAEEIAFILRRVDPELHESLAQRKDIQAKFFAKEEQPAYVLAIDIRRSTELMLKARRPELFADFMTELCDQLQDAITGHFGVFDKFTGDGILAFFPDFFTGQDAAYHAVASAHEASGIFINCYKKHRGSFTSILTDVNLATGIDYGGVHLVRVADGLTVVGAPVVYACRLSSGPGGAVLLNQAAYEKLSTQYSRLFYINEQTLEIKHEGSILCYNVKPGNSRLEPKDPEWLSEKLVQEEEPKPAVPGAQSGADDKGADAPKPAAT